MSLSESCLTHNREQKGVDMPARTKARKRATTVAEKCVKNTPLPRTRSTKRVKRLSPPADMPTDESQMGQSESARRQRAGRSRNVPEQLKPYLFKPGVVNNPKGRPKGSISLTSRLRKMLAEPAYKNDKDGKTKGDIVVEMAVAAAAQGDANFFKEIMNRIDGKVSDHIVVESAKKMVDQQAADVAAEVTQIAFEIVDRYIDNEDDQVAFVKELGEGLLSSLSIPAPGDLKPADVQGVIEAG